jgi:hypothetical protein
VGRVAEDLVVGACEDRKGAKCQETGQS